MVFINGMLFCACLFLWINADYEDRLYQRLVTGVVPAGTSQQDMAIALLHASHRLVKPRVALFSDKTVSGATGLREIFLASGDLALIEGSGVCGSYTHVLARALNAANIAVRIAQMKCGEAWGCHIFVEARINERWVVLDPSFDMAFYNSDGSLASFKQVRADWTKHRATVPQDYPAEYAYDDVRYTNWEKIPWIMPAIKSGLDFVRGETAEPISIRTHVLNLYRVYLWACATLLVLTLCGTWYHLRKI